MRSTRWTTKLKCRLSPWITCPTLNGLIWLLRRWVDKELPSWNDHTKQIKCCNRVKEALNLNMVPDRAHMFHVQSCSLYEIVLWIFDLCCHCDIFCFFYFFVLLFVQFLVELIKHWHLFFHSSSNLTPCNALQVKFLVLKNIIVAIFLAKTQMILLSTSYGPPTLKVVINLKILRRFPIWPLIVPLAFQCNFYAFAFGVSKRANHIKDSMFNTAANRIAWMVGCALKEKVTTTLTF